MTIDSKTDSVRAPSSPQKEIIYVQAPYPYSPEEDEINLLELWGVVWRGKWFIMAFTLLCTLIAVYVTLYVLPVTFKSDVVLQPMETDSNSMSRLSGLKGNLPLPISLPGGGNKSANIIDFLKSRNLQARLIEKYNLLPKFYKDTWDEENKKWIIDNPKQKPTIVKTLQSNLLGGFFSVNQDRKSNLITISWIDEDPTFALKMLERIIAELRFYLENEYETDAQKEREFVEDRLALATKDLEYWEQQVPSKNITLAKIQRERLAAQTVYTELRKQLELAKISEAKEFISFKVLDEPFVPENRHKPKRTRICLMSLLTSGFISVTFLFFLNYIFNLKNHKMTKV